VEESVSLKHTSLLRHDGATTLSIMALSILRLGTMDFIVTCDINGTEHNVIMLSFAFYYYYAVSHYAECHCGECHGASMAHNLLNQKVLLDKLLLKKGESCRLAIIWRHNIQQNIIWSRCIQQNDIQNCI
jgi:hypothetical protein